MTGGSINVDKYIAKCGQGLYTERELLENVQKLKGLVAEGINLENNKAKLEAAERALSMKTFMIPRADIPVDTNGVDVANELLKLADSEDFESVIAAKYLQLKESANKRNKEFTLTLLDVRRLMQRKTCFYTKHKFNHLDLNWKRTIDRIDPDKGYVQGNVVACSKWANALKNIMFEKEGAIVKGCKKELHSFMKVVNNLDVNL